MEGRELLWAIRLGGAWFKGIMWFKTFIPGCISQYVGILLLKPESFCEVPRDSWVVVLVCGVF